MVIITLHSDIHIEKINENIYKIGNDCKFMFLFVLLSGYQDQSDQLSWSEHHLT